MVLPLIAWGVIVGGAALLVYASNVGIGIQKESAAKAEVIAKTPQSVLPQNYERDIAGIYKEKSTTPPSSLVTQEAGKERSQTLTINTPTGASITETTPTGTVIKQMGGETPKTPATPSLNLSEWIPIILIIGIVLIAIVILWK